MQAPPHVLKSKEDMYGGVIIDPAQLTAATAPEAFATQLRESLDFWRSAGKRGVWLRVPLAAAALVPVAASQGFMFHHAEPDYVMMTEWLGTGASTLPANASHQVQWRGVLAWRGVACVIPVFVSMCVRRRIQLACVLLATRVS